MTMRSGGPARRASRFAVAAAIGGAATLFLAGTAHAGNDGGCRR
jgi:hypothetical protein